VQPDFGKVTRYRLDNEEWSRRERQLMTREASPTFFFFYSYSFFLVSSRPPWLRETFLDLICFIQIYSDRCCSGLLWSWHFSLQEKFLSLVSQDVTARCPCSCDLNGPSTSVIPIVRIVNASRHLVFRDYPTFFVSEKFEIAKRRLRIAAKQPLNALDFERPNRTNEMR